MYHKSQSYDIWFLRYQLQQTDFFCHLGPFLPFYPPNSPKNENIKKKKKKIPGDIIILHKCTKTHDHRLYCSWDMVRDDCNYCILFWASFWPSTPLTAQKIKISKKKEKNTWTYIILRKYTKNHDYMLYCSWDMMCDRCNCHFSFLASFCPFTP